MNTQELIHPAEASPSAGSLAPAISNPCRGAGLQANWNDTSSRIKPYQASIQPARLREFPERFCTTTLPASHRWGVVLAGGDSSELQGSLSKPAVLTKTREIAERSVPLDQIVYSVTQTQEGYYHSCHADRAAQTMVRPSDKGTAPAILSALIHIVRRDPNAIVAVLPCDRSDSPVCALTAALESALHMSELHSASIVLLGQEPQDTQDTEVDSGGSEIKEGVCDHCGLAKVERLREKPSRPVSKTLLRAGSFQNIFVMVGHVCTFLEIAWAAVPGLLRELESQEQMSLPSAEIRIPTTVFDRIAPTDFIRDVLGPATDRLVALQLSDVEQTGFTDPSCQSALNFTCQPRPERSHRCRATA